MRFCVHFTGSQSSNESTISTLPSVSLQLLAQVLKTLPTVSGFSGFMLSPSPPPDSSVPPDIPSVKIELVVALSPVNHRGLHQGCSVKTMSTGQRSFAYQGPTPHGIRHASSINSFQTAVKTELFLQQGS